MVLKREIFFQSFFQIQEKKLPNRPYSQLLPSLHTLFRIDGIKVYVTIPAIAVKFVYSLKTGQL